MSAADAAHHWTSLISLATLGTNRAPTSPEKLWPTADIGIPTGSSERILLRAAAMTYLRQVSGTRIAAAGIQPQNLAPQVEDRLVSETAAWRLARMLTGEHRNLVPEWFALAARSRLVLPPHWLPVVLERLDLRERVTASAVLGQRAQWLAERNPEWAFTTGTHVPLLVRWLNGTLAERRMELAAMRTVDPTGARIWLQQTWKTDPPDARVAFLETMLSIPGLSDADEPFLESALDDKRKDVRAAAVECLCQLPSSAHARRNLERLSSSMTFDPPGTGFLGKLRKRQLTVGLPEALDEAAVRDGINSKPPAHLKIGERAYWVVQMVCLARPAHWCERFSCDVQTFLDAVLATDYAADLLTALCEAACRYHDAEWISALCTRFQSWSEQIELQDRVGKLLASLIAAAPQASQDAILGQLLGAAHARQLDLLQAALVAGSVGWSADTTRRAFELLEARIRKDAESHTYVFGSMTDWGPRADVPTAAAALSRLLEQYPDKSPWRNALDKLNATIELRAAIRQELLT
jgi:hypothetical protein